MNRIGQEIMHHPVRLLADDIEMALNRYSGCLCKALVRSGQVYYEVARLVDDRLQTQPRRQVCDVSASSPFHFRWTRDAAKLREVPPELGRLAPSKLRRVGHWIHGNT